MIGAFSRHESFHMISDSRKAKRDSFASQRARLHFSSLPLVVGLGVLNGREDRRRGVPSERRDIFSDGLIGFIPSGAH